MANSVLANLIVKITADAKGVSEALTKTDRRLAQLRTELTKTRSAVGLLAGAAGFGYASKQLFELGASVEETGSKFRTVFGESTAEVQGFIDRFGTIAGLSNEQAQAVLATTGSIVQGMGFAKQASAEFSTQVVQLAGDLSSFNNIPIEETSRAIQAALTGEREQLKRLGIVLREADVQQRALANSGKASASALTDQDRATASLQLITERAGVAVGDLARTQDSSANQARQLAAEIQNIKETLAVALMPVMNVAIENFGRFIKGLQIMGAEAAVLGGELKLLLARIKFWDKEGIQKAQESLGFLREAAAQVKLEIVGLGEAAQPAAVALGEGSGTGLAVSIANVAMRSAEASGFVTEFRAATDLAVPSVEALGAASNVAADAQDRLNSSLSKGRSLLGGLGALGGALGFAIPGLGAASGLLSAFSSFSGFFADGGAIPSGGWGIVGERGPEIVAGPATVAPMGGGDTVINLQLVTPTGRAVTDKLTVRQRRDERLGRVIRVPVGAGVIA